MEPTLDCLPCLINHALHVSKMVTDDFNKQLDIMRRTLEEVSHINMHCTPPEMARDIHAIIREVSGESDPYRDLKKFSTEIALALYPELERVLERSDTPFETAVRMAIAANIIDFGANKDFQLSEVKGSILDALKLPINKQEIETLEKVVSENKRILYILDNCGEAVIDRLLLERCGDNLTIAVRGMPVLNDMTPDDVIPSGLGRFTMIDTGDSVPGVSMTHSSKEFLDLFHSVDLIIAKGQGNYESLSETDRPIFFLLRAKCDVIANKMNANLGSLQIISKNLK